MLESYKIKLFLGEPISETLIEIESMKAIRSLTTQYLFFNFRQNILKIILTGKFKNFYQLDAKYEI